MIEFLHIPETYLTNRSIDFSRLKTAMGAAEYVSLGDAEGDTTSTVKTVLDLKAKGVKLIGVETTENATSYWDTRIQNDESASIAYVFGNELIGIDIQVLQQCDEIIQLPTYGNKNSLNVATCVGVIVWDRLRNLELAQMRCINDTVKSTSL